MLKSVVLVSVLSLASFGVAQAKQKVIYHYDSRVEASESVNPFYRELSNSTAAMIDLKHIEEKGESVDFKNVYSLTQLFNVCPTERFAQQPALANCSGFLVGPDLLLTAGHCVIPKSKGGNQCETFAWVFDYRTSEFKNKDFSAENVYRCKEVLEHELDSFQKTDFALIRLDREVKDRAPLTVRTDGKIEIGTDLMMIGNPSGLPTKIADGATVRENSHPEFFTTDLDAFGGNSGSAVFDAQTGIVEGILVRGAKDYERTAKGCYAVNFCSDLAPFGCDGESVTRVTSVNIDKYLQSTQQVK